MTEQRNQYLAWAYSVIKQEVDKGTYGNVTVSMQNGVIGAVKTEISQKPPVDDRKKTP